MKKPKILNNSFEVEKYNLERRREKCMKTKNR